VTNHYRIRQALIEISYWPVLAFYEFTNFLKAAFAAGHFKRQKESSSGGVNLEMYFGEGNSACGIDNFGSI
jgi:hypothetical protein